MTVAGWALLLAIVANTTGGIGLIGLVWLAFKANTLAEHIVPPPTLTADNAADTIRAMNGAPVTASSTERTVTGLIVPYGVPGDTSAGSYAVEPGALALPGDLSRVKLLRGHDRTAAVGYLTATREDSAGLWGTFAVAPGPDGDEAIDAVRNRTRDGLSYEVSRVRYSADRTRVVAARLDAVALCSVPAYDDARAVAASRQQETTGMLTLESARAILADANATAHDRAAAVAFLLNNADATDADRASANEAAGNSPAAPAAAPAAPAAAPAGTPTDAPNLAAVTAGRAPAGIELHGVRRPAAMTAEQGIERLAAAIRGSVDAGQVNAALADVIPGNDTGGAFFQGQWLGELWAAVNAGRPFIDSINRARLTSGLKVYGWKWETKPEVDTYAGNKADIPTNTVKTVPVEEPIRRTAGGWDIDRIYFDLGDAGFLSAFMNAATEDYAVKTEAQVAADLLAGATAETGATDLLDALGILAGNLSTIGANASFIGISGDLWSEYLAITSADAPWWLARQSTVNLGGGKAAVSDLNIFVSPSLPAATVLGGDRRSATYYEASPSPIRVQAVNIPQGGIDVGVFGYDSLIVNDPRALVSVSTAPVVP